MRARPALTFHWTFPRQVCGASREGEEQHDAGRNQTDEDCGRNRPRGDVCASAFSSSGREHDRRAARGGLPQLRSARAAASPRGGMEIHRFARGYARCQAARTGARGAGKGTRRECRRVAVRHRRTADRICERRVRSRAVGPGGSRTGPNDRFDRTSARQRRRSGCAPPRHCGFDRRRGRSAQ